MESLPESEVIDTKSEFIEDLEDPNNKEALEKFHKGVGYKIYNFCEKKNFIKLVKNNIPFDIAYTLFDLSIKVKIKEDELFLKNKDLSLRLRRGHSVIKYKSNEITYVDILRKGLNKFFYLRESHIQLAEGKINDFSEMKNKVARDDILEDDQIMAKVRKAFKNPNTKISILQTTKANGECAQISFFRHRNGKFVEKEYWVACSKNVAILFNNIKEVAEYLDDRYYFAKKIAKIWIDILETKTPQEVNDLKDLLEHHTFVGEYCGHKDHQHIVLYDKECLIFFAIVNKYSKYPCLPLPKAFATLDKFGLDRVEYTAYHGYTNVVNLGIDLRKIYMDVSCSSSDKDGEGNVVYFMATTDNGENVEENMVALAKLKTQEYSIFRKIRETSKRLSNKNLAVGDTLDKFKIDCAKLVNFRELPREEDHYYNLCRKILETVRQQSLNDGFIMWGFARILAVCTKLLSEKRDCKDEDMKPIREEYKQYLSTSKGTFIIEKPEPPKEITLEEIVQQWETIEFTLEPSDETSVITDFYNIQKQIGAHLSNLKTLKSEEKNEYFKTKLQYVNDTIKEWKNFQTNWCYLKHIFSTEIIQKSLPNEAIIFEEVDESWKHKMAQAKNLKSVLKSCTSKDCLEHFKSINQKIETILTGLNLYVENIRTLYDRENNLSNEEIQSVLKKTKDEKEIQELLNKISDDKMLPPEWSEVTTEKENPEDPGERDLNEPKKMEFKSVVIVSPPGLLTLNDLKTLANDFNAEKSNNFNQCLKETLDNNKICLVYKPPRFNSIKLPKHQNIIYVNAESEAVKNHCIEFLEDVNFKGKNNSEYIKNDTALMQLKNHGEKKVIEDYKNNFKIAEKELVKMQGLDYFFVKGDEFFQNEGGIQLSKLKDLISHVMKVSNFIGDQIDSKIEEKQAPIDTTVTYITFIGIPGLGKSYLAKYIISENVLGEDVHVQGVKSDAVWKSIVDSNKNGMEISEIFKKKGKQYQQKMKGLIMKMCSNLKPGKNVLLIDKCNNGDKAQGEFKFVYKSEFNLRVKKIKTIVIVPKISVPLKMGKFTYAASISLIMNCMLRVIDREGHETVSGPDIDRILLIMNFLTTFGHKHSFVDVAKNTSGYDCIIEAEFHNQNLDDVFDFTLTENLVNIVRNSPGQFKLENSAEILEYLEQFKEFCKRYKAGEIKNEGEGLFGYEYTKNWKETFELIKQSI